MAHLTYSFFNDTSILKALFSMIRYMHTHQSPFFQSMTDFSHQGNSQILISQHHASAYLHATFFVGVIATHCNYFQAIQNSQNQNSNWRNEIWAAVVMIIAYSSFLLSNQRQRIFGDQRSGYRVHDCVLHCSFDLASCAENKSAVRKVYRSIWIVSLLDERSNVQQNSVVYSLVCGASF